MEADVYQQLTGVSSEGLGLLKLFLMNTNKHHSRYIISAHRQNRSQQTNSCTNKDIFLLHFTINIILQPHIRSKEMHQFTQLCAKIITFCRKDVQNMRICEPFFSS